MCQGSRLYEAGLVFGQLDMHGCHDNLRQILLIDIERHQAILHILDDRLVAVFSFLMQTFLINSCQALTVDLLRIIKRWIFQTVPILSDRGDSPPYSLLQVAVQD